MSRYGVIGGAYTSESPVADAETLVNWYVEKMEADGANSSAVLYPRPGLTAFCTLPEGPLRGELEINGRFFAVGGTKFCEVDSGGTVTVRGTVANDGTPVSLSASQTELLVVSGGICYGYSLATDVLTAISVTVVAALSNLRAATGAAVESINILIDSISQSGTLVTVTIAAPLFDYYPWVGPGDPITITGVPVGGYNTASSPIVSISGNTLTYNAGPGLAPSSGGRVRLYIVAFYTDTNAASGASAGQQVVVAGCSDVSYNATWTAGEVIRIHLYHAGDFYEKIMCHATSAMIGHGVGDGGTITPQTTVPILGVMGAFCDGFFLRLLSNSQEWGVSSPLDVTSWDLTDTSKISVFPDNAVSMITDHRQVVMFGRTKTVIYYDSGNFFPFDVLSGGDIEQGCGASFSPVRLDNSVFWLGQDERGPLIAWRLNGATPVRVSTHALENEWRGYAVTSDAVSFSYQWNGHSFWEIYFPSANKSWVYDASIGLWHREGTWNGADWDAHRACCHAYAFGLHLVGDPLSGNIYKFDAAAIVATYDFGSPAMFERQAPPISTEDEYLYHRQASFKVESLGAGAATLNLDWSDDGGSNYASPRVLDATKAGHEKHKRVVTRMLGRSRSRTYRIRTSNPLRVIDGYVKAGPGMDQPEERLPKRMAKMA